MKDLTWGDALSVQIEEIDEDHKKLVELFNILNHSVMEDDAADYIDAVLLELMYCTDWQFGHEERLMLKYGYEGLAEHREEHQALIESAADLQQKCLQEGRTLLIEDIEFLEHWLTGHILGADMDLGSYLGEEM